MDPLPLTWTTPRGSTGIVGSCSRSAAAVDCGAARELGIRRKWAAVCCRDPVPKGEEALSESRTIAHAMSAHAMIHAEGDNITDPEDVYWAAVCGRDPVPDSLRP